MAEDGIPRVAAALGAAYALAGRADEALPLVAGAVEEFRSRQTHNRPVFILLCAGTTYLAAGRITEAASHAREALALTRRLGARGSEAHTLCLAGDVASTGGAEDADSYYGEALALATVLGMRPLSPTAISATASSTGGRANTSRPASTSPRRRRCTARWTCGSGWSKRRWR